MKKVLIVANLFHASPRIPGLAKYLPEFGWQPIILTTPIGENARAHRFGPPNDFKENNRVIETYGYSSPYGKKRLTSKKYSRVRPFLKFLYKYYREIAHYPDEEKRWKPFAVRAACELLQNEHIDAVISSSSPVTSHLIAKELKVKYEIPWIAELRDLWSQNHNYPYGPVRKFFDRRLEVKTLSKADALITVNPPEKQKLKTLHKGKKIYSISHGFDPEQLNDPPSKLTQKFTITYTGQIYVGKQDPSKLFVVLRDLISNGTIDPNDVEVRFYGYRELWLAEEIEEYGLSSIIKLHERVPRKVVLGKQRESQLLLKLNWEDPQHKGSGGIKLIEYLAAQRPIIAIGGFGGDFAEGLLDETRAGVYAKTVEDVKEALTKLYSQYKREGKTAFTGDIKEINKYSYREMAKKFAEILDRIT